MPGAEWGGRPVVLTVEGLGKAYGTRRVLRDFDLRATGGEVVAVTGANGSGKSTLLKIVAGLLRPARGTVTLTVGEEARTDGAARRASVGYAAPDVMLYPELSGRENLRYFDAVASRTRPDAEYTLLLETVGLENGRQKRGDDRLGAYSSGMRQRLRLAFALLPSAPLLLLDEPSLALDAGGVTMVEQIIAAQKTRGGLTLLATNDPREVALGDRSVAVGA